MSYSKSNTENLTEEVFSRLHTRNLKGIYLYIYIYIYVCVCVCVFKQLLILIIIEDETVIKLARA